MPVFTYTSINFTGPDAKVSLLGDGYRYRRSYLVEIAPERNATDRTGGSPVSTCDFCVALRKACRRHRGGDFDVRSKRAGED